jgi:hypothetical protein
MNISRSLAVAGLILGSATFTVYAAVDRTQGLQPPTSTQLGLSGTYATQWDDLRTQTLNLRRSASTSAAQRIAHLRQILATSAPDLDAFNRSAEQESDALRAQARALRAKKIALYDSLPAAQQAHLRKLLGDRLEQLQNLPAFKRWMDQSIGSDVSP